MNKHQLTAVRHLSSALLTADTVVARHVNGNLYILPAEYAGTMYLRQCDEKGNALNGLGAHVAFRNLTLYVAH